jgi:murein DD-endopeptidase MepM/ murein hydrolase activator NlpD
MEKSTSGKFSNFIKNNSFNLISWSATALIVAALAGFAFWWTQIGSAAPASSPEPTAAPTTSQSSGAPVTTANKSNSSFSIGRQIELKTNLSQQSSTDIVQYQVVSGDSLFSIAKQFNIKPETILYSNKDSLHDSPDNLKPGMTLTIPPVDGLLYTWQSGDTLEKVATEFKAKVDNILNWPGNNIDLTDPQIKDGTVVMIPGGQRQLIDWSSFIPTISRGVTGAGTGTSNIATSSCSGGPVDSNLHWPTHGPHTISGNDYGPTHLGIDISAVYVPVYASASGVVVLAGWSQYGYGNFIEIDHGQFQTIYAHLSVIGVSICQSVYGGQQIGVSGNTGDSTGPHLHFEVREGGVSINPWSVVAYP